MSPFSSTPPDYAFLPSTAPDTRPPTSFIRLDPIQGLEASLILPCYPLLLVVVHFLLALRLLPLSTTNSLLVFLFFTIALSVSHGRLVLVISKPTSLLQFYEKRWTALNTHLLSASVCLGFLMAPEEGGWEGGRVLLLSWLLLVIGAVTGFVNVGELVVHEGGEGAFDL